MRKSLSLLVLLISIIPCLSGCSTAERSSPPASSAAPAATTASNANMNSSNSNAYSSGAPAGGAATSNSSGSGPFLNNNANRTPSRDIKPPQKSQSKP